MVPSMVVLLNVISSSHKACRQKSRGGGHHPIVSSMLLGESYLTSCPHILVITCPQPTSQVARYYDCTMTTLLLSQWGKGHLSALRQQPH